MIPQYIWGLLALILIIVIVLLLINALDSAAYV